MINDFKNNLLSVLIGLARATENNENLITATTNQLIIESLYVTSEKTKADTSQIQQLMFKIDNEKRRIIPNCYQCVASCGRNDNYNIDNLEKEKESIKVLKLSILKTLQNIAENIYINNIQNNNIYNYLYKALIIIGLDDLNEHYLQNILDDIKSIKKA